MTTQTLSDLRRGHGARRPVPPKSLQDPTRAGQAASAVRVSFEISPGSALRLLLAMMAGLACASLSLQFMYHMDYPISATLAWRFDLDRENNIPTWFSSGLLALCSALLAIIAKARSRPRRQP